MARSRRSEAAARAEADRAYLESMRGGVATQEPGYQPVAPGPAPIEQTDVMPHVPTAAPMPARGVSPILGETAATSPPPVGSFTAPPVGPPSPAYPSQAFVPAQDAVSPSASASPVGGVGQVGGPAGGFGATGGFGAASGSGAAGRFGAGGFDSADGVGPGPLRKAGSHVEQDPVGTPVTMMAAPSYPAAPYGAAPYPAAPSSAPSLAKQPPMSPSFDLPLLLGPNGVGPTGDLVTCPECGEMATVDPGRRKSEDFCRNCDFPLFWARPTVILASGEETGASLRRLPGTVGRAATAALMCPHCGEPNSPVAQTCVRCLLSLHPVEAPPPPVYIAPEPEPLPVPVGRDFPLWWILLVSFCLLAITLIVVWVALN